MSEFKVGDFVVFAEFFINDTRVTKILSIDNGCSKLSNGWNIQNDWLQHATPKEIEQGFRDE